MSKTDIFFTIVIPTHFRYKSLEMLLLSLSEQSLNAQHWKIVIVKSPGDLSEEKLKDQFRKKLTMTWSEVPIDPSGGKNPALKRNYGVSLANSPWIAFIDDDCIADKDWLKNARDLIKTDTTIRAIEGKTEIPEGINTLTAQGLKRLSLPGGYQTCNMFYHRNSFLEVGGFDKEFSFYFEDSELAWNFIQHKFPIVYSKNIKVTHPVLAPNPRKMLYIAKRSQQLVYLRKKHPRMYANGKFQIIRRRYLIYPVIFVGILWTILLQNVTIAAALSLIYFLVLTLHMVKLFYGKKFICSELLLTALFTPLVPLFNGFFAIKGFYLYRIRNNF